MMGWKESNISDHVTEVRYSQGRDSYYKDQGDGLVQYKDAILPV